MNLSKRNLMSTGLGNHDGMACASPDKRNAHAGLYRVDHSVDGG